MFVPFYKQQLVRWVSPSNSKLKKPRLVPWANKVIETNFWKRRGLIYIDYLRKVKKINSEYYTNLSVWLKDTTQRRNFFNWVRNCSIFAIFYGEYILFWNLKRWLRGKSFGFKDEIIKYKPISKSSTNIVLWKESKSWRKVERSVSKSKESDYCVK